MRGVADRLINSSKFVVVSSFLQFVIDMTIWSLTAIAASYARFEYQGHHDPFSATQSSVIRVLPFVLVVHAVVGYVVGIYRRRWRYGSFDEVGGLVLATAITTGILLVLRFFDESINPFPRSVIFLAGFAGLCFVAASRYLWRLIREQLRRPTAQTVGMVDHQYRKGQQHNGNGGQDIAPLGPGEEKQQHPHGHHQSSRAEIRLEDNQSRKCEDDSDRHQVTPFEFVDPGLIDGKVVREAEHHREFGKLRYLQAHRSDPKPSFATLHLNTDVRHQNQD